MIQCLLSVPAPLARFFASPAAPERTRHFATFVHSDPPGRKLGSGGGTVALLHAAWQARRPRGLSWNEWLLAHQSLVIHAGGESRRLPAYAALGKSLLPVPALGSPIPRRFDQTLIDFQRPAYSEVLREAGAKPAVLVASGDVWLELDAQQIPAIGADICGIGMRVTPEVAQHFGVFFVEKASGGAAMREQPIAFFLQKPSPAEIYRHLSRHDFYVDTGLWLLSCDAVQFLFRRCGWNERTQSFATADGHPRFLDLYTELGVALGSRTQAPAGLRRFGWSRLKTSIVPLDDARFFHVGSSRQLLESFDQLLRSTNREARLMGAASARTRVELGSALPAWIDSHAASRPLQLAGLNLATGLPAGAAALRLRQEQCLEVAPTGNQEFIVRPYRLDDRLRGAASKDGLICGQPAAAWLSRRAISFDAAADVFDLPIYPALPAEEINQDIVDWFFAETPAPDLTARLAKARRYSAAEIPARVNFQRYFAQRQAAHGLALLEEFEACLKTGDTRVFAQDFAAIADRAAEFSSLRRWLVKHHTPLLARLSRPEHQSRLLMLLAQLHRGAARARFARLAAQRLQTSIVASTELAAARPRLALKEDQIVWGRSPVRLDLAGGWTDTPPYCLEHGGAVLNVAVLLNGQPPIQVFVRPLAEPIVSLRSIDLGTHEVIATDEALATFRDPRSGFSLPKAALALAGFHADFATGRPHATLRRRLEAFGGGLEISLLSAVPKGSGLGTSSILGATLLGVLNRACRLGWDEVALYNRVLAVEQLLTTGGGWQDQAGALFRGVKLVQTAPGSAQTPSVRFLPGHLFDAPHANRTLLLYYTGITRLAKGILAEIVEDMFLGRFETLQTLNLIRGNALNLFTAVQQGNVAGLHRCIGRSWDLNKRLDPGTSTPEIEKLLRQCGPDLAAAKLLGAGGGGYMLLCAKTPEAGQRIRDRLESAPPNRRARFIDFQLAERGLEVTVS